MPRTQDQRGLKNQPPVIADGTVFDSGVAMRHDAPSLSCLARHLARVVLAFLFLPLLPAQTTERVAADELRTGDYERAIEVARAVREADPTNESAWRAEAEALITLGRYEDAVSLLDNALPALPGSLRLRLLLRDAALHAGQPERAVLTVRDVMQAIEFTSLLQGHAAARAPEFQTAVGEASLIAGLEPRLALENFLRPSQAATPPIRDAFLVTGRLALEKRDFALASRTFRAGLATFQDDPDLLWGLAASFRNGERHALAEAASQALAINPRHVPTLLLLAEQFIDAEQHDRAAQHLDRLLAVNPRHPEAHALRAVLASIARDPFASRQHRDRALATWKNNPRVDHLIGRKLSERYQFAEGAEAQRRALAADPGFVPAQVQLAQDLLRLGREDEGWALAAHAHQADGYNVEAYNLTTLRDRLAAFTVLTSPHFRVRMSNTEAPVYGDRVLELLERAHDQLTTRYGLELETPTTVEIYPDPNDFAVRTFGMPDIGGFLGVCFGPVFTVNSPASAHANWEAVLWHEFTHVITLTLTRNRMPRWLSEGISVYEEREADPRWDRRLSLDDRERIVSGRLHPISRMSAAFLGAKEPEDTQFAYLQSGLIVEYLVEHYGFDRLRSLLRSLADGREMNDALAEHYGAIDALDAAFAEHARTLAAQVAPGFDLRRPEGQMARLLADHAPLLGQRPNLHLQLEEAQQAMERRDWAAARDILETLTEDGLYLTGQHNLHLRLARVYAELGEHDAEHAAWLAVARHEADSLDAVTRLLDFARNKQDWPEVERWVDAWLAIHPLAPTPWRALLDAHEARHRPDAAARAGQVLLQLDPPDFASVHFRVARALIETDPGAARHHVLRALEEAPRFREAYHLLAQLPPHPLSAP